MGRNWVIDPIDGTNNFIAGLGNFAVCIALLDAGYPVLGVVYDVTRDQVYSAAKGHGAWLGARELRVLETPISDSSMLMMTSNLLTNNRCPQWAYRWLAQTQMKARILGSAALEAVQVGAGVAHGAITVNGKLWDVAAPAAIVLEAGGKLTNFKGEPVFPFKLDKYQGAKVPFVAAAPLAHEPLLRDIRSYP
jgi:myo-inositol-1(or 4)-monophosphatase